MPTYESDLHWLEVAVRSVQRQVYPHWELCIVDDASTDPAVHGLLARLAAEDARIRVQRRATNGHISRASNDAMAMARGSHVALLDHDDELSPLALLLAAVALAQRPDVRLLCTDEDIVSVDGVHRDAHRKGRLNRDLLLGQNSFSHLGVYETALVRQVGGFRVGFEGSQDHDLVLRCVEQLADSEIAHLPFVAYHWRALPTSAAGTGEAKPYAWRAGQRAVSEHLIRRGSAGVMAAAENRSGYREVMVGDPGLEVDVIAVPAGATGAQLHALVAAGGRDTIILLREGAELRSGWQQALAPRLGRPGVGIVGGRLVTRDGRTSRGAWAVSRGRARLLYARMPELEPVMRRYALEQTVTAVSSDLLAISRSTYGRVGGFDRSRRRHADIDLCLRAAQLGLRTVYDPELVAGPVSRRTPWQADALHRVRQRGLPARDPFYPAAFSGLRMSWRARLRDDPTGLAWLRRQAGRGDVAT